MRQRSSPIPHPAPIKMYSRILSPPRGPLLPPVMVAVTAVKEETVPMEIEAIVVLDGSVVELELNSGEGDTRPPNFSIK